MTSKNQLKSHFVVKRRILVVFDQDIQIVYRCMYSSNPNKYLVLSGFI